VGVLLARCHTRRSYTKRHTEGLAETVECRSLQEIQALEEPYFVRDLASDSWEILLARVHGLHRWGIRLFFFRHDFEKDKFPVPVCRQRALNQLVYENTMANTEVLQRQENREARMYTLKKQSS